MRSTTESGSEEEWYTSTSRHLFRIAIDTRLWTISEPWASHTSSGVLWRHS